MRDPQKKEQKESPVEMFVAIEARNRKRRRIETTVFFSILIGFVAIAVGLILWSMNKGACSDAQILNEVYGTEYTCSDVLWSSNLIEDIWLNK
jgi:type VI protein secretion system component VasF